MLDTRKWAAMSALFFFTSSCASYTAQSVPVLTVESTAFSGEEEGLRVGVTSFSDKEKSMQTFGADLKAVNILALQVAVKNSAPQRLALRKTDFALRLSDGNEHLPAPTTSVATRLESNAGVIGWTVAFGIIGLLASSSQQDKADSARRADLRNKEFQDTTLASQETAHGFLFYLIPDHVRELKNVTLVARGVEVQALRKVTVTVPLLDLGEWNAKNDHSN
jgi:hypothetical protein